MDIVKETPMKAEIILAVDKNGAEIFLLVVKGTFDIPLDGSVPLLSIEQANLVYADEYYGDPATTSIKCAYDFALSKPMTDVIVMGSAHAPGGMPTPVLRVNVRIGNIIDKTIQVIGDRIWQRRLLRGARPTKPEPFVSMPLVYERAFGGSDTTHENSKRHRFHLENPVGTGCHVNRKADRLVGKRLPNLEHPNRHIAGWGDQTPTVCFGFTCPGWKPRIDYAGTYNNSYMENRFPLLPEDFDDRFFQSAPPDQIVPHLIGGEQVTLTNLCPHGNLSFPLPRIELPVIFVYSNRPAEHYKPALDTVIIEPDAGKLKLVWRIAIRVVGKPYALRQVIVGEMSKRWWRRYRSFKPHYPSLDALIRSPRELL